MGNSMVSGFRLRFSLKSIHWIWRYDLHFCYSTCPFGCWLLRLDISFDAMSWSGGSGPRHADGHRFSAALLRRVFHAPIPICAHFSVGNDEIGFIPPRFLGMWKGIDWNQNWASWLKCASPPKNHGWNGTVARQIWPFLDSDLSIPLRVRWPVESDWPVFIHWIIFQTSVTTTCFNQPIGSYQYTYQIQSTFFWRPCCLDLAPAPGSGPSSPWSADRGQRSCCSATTEVAANRCSCCCWGGSVLLIRSWLGVVGCNWLFATGWLQLVSWLVGWVNLQLPSGKTWQWTNRHWERWCCQQNKPPLLAGDFSS
jgi:hypothetical protein